MLFEMVNTFLHTCENRIQIEDIAERMIRVVYESGSADATRSALDKDFDPSRVVESLVGECLNRKQGDPAIASCVFAARSELLCFFHIIMC